MNKPIGNKEKIERFIREFNANFFIGQEDYFQSSYNEFKTTTQKFEDSSNYWSLRKFYSLGKLILKQLYVKSKIYRDSFNLDKLRAEHILETKTIKNQLLAQIKHEKESIRLLLNDSKKQPNDYKKVVGLKDKLTVKQHQQNISKLTAELNSKLKNLSIKYQHNKALLVDRHKALANYNLRNLYHKNKIKLKAMYKEIKVWI